MYVKVKTIETDTTHCVAKKNQKGQGQGQCISDTI